MNDVSSILTGAQRLLREEPRQKSAITVAELGRMTEALALREPYLSRNRALLLFGFASALRRSNLVQLNLGDIEFGEHGIICSIQKEKQDQTGAGRRIGIPHGAHAGTCPVLAVKHWLERRGGEPGPLFSSIHNGHIYPSVHIHANTIAQIVKRAVSSIGLDEARYAGHSLRAGFVTEALAAGVGEVVTARHTGHRSLQTLRRYLRPEDPFQANACAALDL